MDTEIGKKGPEHFYVHYGVTFNLHNISILHIRTLGTESFSHLPSSSLSIHPLDKYLLSSYYLPVTGVGNRRTCKIDMVPALKDLRVQHGIKHGIIKIIIA